MNHIIVDLDGTLADNSHRQYLIESGGKKNWRAFFDACDKDTPVSALIKLLVTLYTPNASRLSIHILSGRSETVRQKTIDWLAANFPYPHTLTMRSVNDFRDDWVVKGEMAETLGLSPSNTLCVFDDRKSVVEMWRSKGFLCLQVADHDF